MCQTTEGLPITTSEQLGGNPQDEPVENGGSTSATLPEPVRVAGVYAKPLERLAGILRHKLVQVIAANMFFEEETGIRNQAGQDNLTEALSHIGTLFEHAETMAEEEQLFEVHELEDHLRRSMMESYEETFLRHMGDIEKAWEQHSRLTRPLQQEGKLVGVPDLDQLDGLRTKCKRLHRQGRLSKRGQSWDVWEKGTNLLIEACEVQGQLLSKLNEGIRAAEQYRADQEAKAHAEHLQAESQQLTKSETDRGIRFSRKMAVLSIIVGVLLLGAGWGLNELTTDDVERPATPTEKRNRPPKPGGTQDSKPTGPKAQQK